MFTTTECFKFRTWSPVTSDQEMSGCGWRKDANCRLMTQLHGMSYEICRSYATAQNTFAANQVFPPD